MSDTSTLVGLSQSYIETLTQDLTSAEYCYNEYHIATLKAEDEYDLSLQWETCLKDYLGKIGTTYSMVTHLDAYVAKMLEHTTKICSTVSLAKDASNILMICVRCLSEQNEHLKKSIKELLEIIDCLNDPILISNVSIMKCLEDLKGKVDVGLVAVLNAIKELLNLMKCILELENKICCTTEVPSGLLEDLNRLVAILNCSYPPIPDHSDRICEDVDSTYATPSPAILNCPNCKNDCGEETIAAPSTMVCSTNDFKPSLCDNCGNSFHRQLLNEYTIASQQTCYARCVWEYFKDLEQKAKSNRDAIKAALSAAVTAKAKCK